MLSKFIGEKRVYQLYLFAYCVLVFGLAYKNLVMSLATIFLVLLTLLDFNLSTYTQKIKGNKLLRFILFFLTIHLLSLIWTNNFDYFFKDFNTKLTFYALPLIFVLKPIEKRKHLLLIFAFFLLSILVFSVLNFVSFYRSGAIYAYNMRLESQFISHIRFGLMLVFASLICSYWILTKTLKFRFIPIILLAWFLIYIYYSEVLISYILCIVLVFIYLLFWIFHKKKHRKLAIALIIAFVSFLILSIAYIFNTLKIDEDTLQKKDLLEYTKEGNKYTHYPNTRVYINGNHVFSNISDFELHREWNKVSKFNLRDTNKLSYQHYFTLIQYMASKGLNKDAEGFKHLSLKDIRKIEAGRTNYLENKKGLLNRVKTLYKEGYNSDPNGKSAMQRIEYLKTGFKIFKNNPILGVGSGDLQDAFNFQYFKDKSILKKEYRLRTHNQILTYFISFGLIGGFLFLLIFYKSFQFFYQHKMYLAISFLLIVFLSFFTEDTLETQAGVTFFSFFFGLFISLKSNLLADES